MPTVSIGLPVYNGEKFLEESIDSVLNQTFQDFELIISDNASTDSTPDICKKYTDKDPRVSYHRNDTNRGAAYNFNRVFELSTGEYFRWATYDDRMAPEYIQRCLEVLKSRPDVVLCYPGTILMDEEGAEIQKYSDNLDIQDEKSYQRLSRFLISVNLANAVLGLIRSDVLNKTRLIGSFVGSDYILLVELSLLGKIAEHPEYLFFRRDHSLNVRKLTLEERAKWFDPETEYNYNCSNRLITEMLRGISCLDLSKKEKLLSYLQVRRWIFRKWRAKAGLIKSDMKRLVFGGRRQTSPLK